MSDTRPSHLVVVGGPRSVSEAAVLQAAAAAGIATSTPGAIVRFGGASRYDVALAVAEEMGVADTAPVVVASGEVFPDALSISASAAENGEPILLVGSRTIQEDVREFVERGSRSITVVGGTSTIPDSTLEGWRYRRLAGSNRYEANWSVLLDRYGEADRKQPMIASGAVFPDALVLGPYAAKQSRPILLMGKTATSTKLRPWVYEHRDETLDVDVVGGPASVSAYASQMFEKWRMNRH